MKLPTTELFLKLLLKPSMSTVLIMNYKVKSFLGLSLKKESLSMKSPKTISNKFSKNLKSKYSNIVLHFVEFTHLPKWKMTNNWPSSTTKMSKTLTKLSKHKLYNNFKNGKLGLSILTVLLNYSSEKLFLQKSSIKLLKKFNASQTKEK